MKKILKINKILNFVQKPARYIGNELNSYPANMSSDFSIVLCFPDIYEIGASNLGIEILYHLINEKKLARCERVFAPDLDMEYFLKKNNLNLFSLESKSDLKEFDIIGFTIQYELVATNILNILSLSDISIFSKNRKLHEPIVMAGGPALTNPEPFADFFDLFVLGDGEEVIEEIINICRQSKKNKVPRNKILERLSYVDGVYVPSFYDINYHENNTIKSILPISNTVKSIISKRFSDFENVYDLKKRIVPFIRTVHNRLNIEIARGCPGRCRFCQASKYYSPWRQRSTKKILNIIKTGIKSTGFDEITLSSLSCSDYKCLYKLLIEINNLYKYSNINISLPSLRCNENSLDLIKYINKSKKPTLTFAPEAGSDRLRNVIGKYLSEEQIVKTILAANAMGWKIIKLYFMIGLPTETHTDILGIVRLIKFIKKQSKGLNFTVAISPFIPKANTVFQWVQMENMTEMRQKMLFLKKTLQANVKIHDYKASILEALIARGDRRLSYVIYKAWLKGLRFNQWNNKLDNDDTFNKILIENNVNLDSYLYRNRKYDEILPWDHIYFGTSKKELYNDYVKSMKESFTNDIINQYNYEYKHLQLTKKYIEKKYEVPIINSVMRLRFRFSKKGIIRFVSHLEQIEVFRRAVRRANLPVAFTLGFSPQIKSSYGPPISVGQESSSEYMELNFTQEVNIRNIKLKLSKMLPTGFKILDIKKIPLNFPSIDILSNVAEYKIKNINITQQEIDKILSQDKIFVKVLKKKKIIEIDIKSLIRLLRIKNTTLILQLRFSSKKTVKPEIVLREILKNKLNFLTVYDIERTRLYIEAQNGNMYVP
ncbi:MAG: TIGR03960 family B12-binding radical SAM protein [Endomicrobium sp.]|jgi:radical SAM family uncharacterized protein/radical SAM-linked protein|nr:TIGR03960 family B12-binding radical SAM protein [Endomicrobium sp.]